MNDRLLSLLGICRRAGRLTIGCDPVKESIETGKTCLVLAASDISANTASKVIPVAERFSVDFVTISRCKDELSFSLGKTAAVVSVTDEGFAKKLREIISAECKGGN